jgi:hypothetical protein
MAVQAVLYEFDVGEEIPAAARSRPGCRLRHTESMTRLVPQVTGWAVLAAAAVTAVTGCVSTAESPSQVRKQASQVSLMISSAMGTGPLTEAGLIQIVESNGGGYVTAITRSGRAGTGSERTVVHAVLGTSIVSAADDPQDGGLPGPWLSPVQAPCTGAAALAASGWISNNPAAGG